MALNKEDFNKVSAYLLDTETTRIVIQSIDKNTLLTRDVAGVHTDKTDEVQIQLVLDLLAIEIDPTGTIAKMQNDQDRLTAALEQANALNGKMQLILLNVSADQDNLYDLIDGIYEHLGLELVKKEDSEDEDEEGEENDSKKESDTASNGSTTEDIGGDNHHEE